MKSEKIIRLKYETPIISPSPLPNLHINYSLTHLSPKLHMHYLLWWIFFIWNCDYVLINCCAHSNEEYFVHGFFFEMNYAIVSNLFKLFANLKLFSSFPPSKSFFPPKYLIKFWFPQFMTKRVSFWGFILLFVWLKR